MSPPVRPWPLWRKILAYAALSALALTAIYFVDLKVHRAAVMPASKGEETRGK